MEREGELVGAVVVKPTRTQFIQRFQLTQITGMDESTRLLLPRNFKVVLFFFYAGAAVQGSVWMSVRMISGRILLLAHDLQQGHIVGCDATLL